VADWYGCRAQGVDFKKVDPVCTLDDEYILPNTRGYHDSVFCPHDGIAQVTTGRKMISQDAYLVLLVLFVDGFPALGEEVKACERCMAKKGEVKDEKVRGV
jgi:hypothetical protein